MTPGIAQSVQHQQHQSSPVPVYSNNGIEIFEQPQQQQEKKQEIVPPLLHNNARHPHNEEKKTKERRNDNKKLFRKMMAEFQKREERLLAEFQKRDELLLSEMAKLNEKIDKYQPRVVVDPNNSKRFGLCLLCEGKGTNEWAERHCFFLVRLTSTSRSSRMNVINQENPRGVKILHEIKTPNSFNMWSALKSRLGKKIDTYYNRFEIKDRNVNINDIINIINQINNVDRVSF
jgi:hypothetical protein